jgi:hypothetical protein
VLFFLLATAGYYMWYGGSAFGPRMVIPALPFLCLGLPSPSPGRARSVFGVLLAISVANQLAATAVEPSRRWCGRALRLPLPAPPAR